MNRRRFLELASGAGLLALGCSGPRRPPPHVVCVLVDQLRPDSFERWASATLRLAESGVRFDRMRSVAPWTYPSVISLMSGLLPGQHGADGFGKSRTLTTFAPEVPLLPARLRADGWHTAAFITNPFLREWNPFHVGFETFSADFVKNLGNTRAGFHEFGIPEKMFAGFVNDEVRRHFSGRPVDAPEFTYVHYIDAHGPWEGAPFSPDYESAIRFVDARIAELWAFFRRRYDGDLLFLVTSDHGQAVGDDVAVGSGPKLREMKQSLHDFNLRIPFVVLGDPARVAAGRSVSFPCTNLDVVPTLLEIAGLRPSMPLPGTSLGPWIQPGKTPSSPERALYFTVSAFGSCSDALLWRGKKYLRFRDCASGEVTVRQVFDPESDPREIRELAVPFDEAEVRMDRAAAGEGIRFEPTLEPLSEELAEKLRALGYVE